MKKKRMLTNKDIFAGWKNMRFIVAPNYTFRDNKINFKHLIILTDIKFWALATDDLTIWCKEHNCRTQGMTVEIPTNEALTLFCLRWA